MNKFIKILICNIALILFTLFCMEIYFFYKTYCWEVENKKKLSYLEYGNDKYFSTQEKLELIKYTFLSKYKNEGEFNDDMYRCIDCAQDKTNNKPPIVLLGCSFTHGFTLKNNQTFNAILNKITNRKVYNWGVMGASPREMLLTLRKKHFVKDIEPPEYIIYTYISDHRRRLYSPLIDLNINVYKTKDKLVEYKQPQIVYSSLLIKEILNLYANKKSQSIDSVKLFKSYITEIGKEIKTLYGEETKFVILVYEDDGIINWKEIEEMNINKNKIIVLNAKDITNTNFNTVEYQLPNDHHPNAKAWEVIVPALVKELDL